ncbi:N-acetyl sugar amidotransferase [Geminocystis sp. CENA526]|uniref:N-acetyl sugar amidotransferase n=1 Tax=Geminocystis sp. CENA526 TaxID=1355871 RepID=UPI003D701D37
MKYCTKCVYPQVSVNLELDEEGVCSACRVAEKFEELSEEFWAMREQKFAKIVDRIVKKNQSNYDCIIPVSGGKDSYFQTYIMAEKYGLKPLLVTYHGNNYLPEGDYNRDRMRHLFNADHLVYGPSVEVLKKLNRICFKKMGDMNWQNHCGIFTLPVIVAVKFNIPLVIWGETTWDISGMYEPDDFVEFSNRVRHEHGLRGYEWYDLINEPDEPLTEKDMMWAKYPTDEEILKVGVRGLYIGNFFKWNPYKHTDLMKQKYQWKEAEQPFERTYRRISNLDDRYENGIHDLLKFVKFGYGRASDHASKDIRLGYMSREEGIEKVREMDHVVSSDLEYWLNYVNMTETEFWEIADTFRNPRVWWIENDMWYKDNIWGEPSAYGSVYLKDSDRAKYLR